MIHICEAIEENYSGIMVLFSDRRGLDIHVLDFNLKDWTFYNEKNRIKSHEVARFKYTKPLASMCDGFNRTHFIVATDLMRVVSLPYSLNAESGLISLPIGNRKSLEKLRIHNLLHEANPYLRSRE